MANNEKIKIVWFRNDLRLHDNAALTSAIETADKIIPVYILDPRNFHDNQFGFQKTGIFRTRFLWDCVHDLNNNLKQIGSDLIIRSGYPERILPELCKQFSVTSVYYNKEVAPEEIAVEKRLENELLKIDVNLKDTWCSTLYTKKELAFSIPRMPDVFADFRKKTERESVCSAPIPAPGKIVTPDISEPGELPPLSDIINEEFVADERDSNHFKGGETNALIHLHNYFWVSQDVRHYHDTRNELVGKSYSSKFSPWLALGCLSPRRIYQELKKFELEVEENKSTQWLKLELMWRDFFRFSMEKHFDKYFTLTGIRTKNSMELSNDKRKFLQWAEGRTGVEFIDASMHELNKTGFMSNRARQVVASYLVHDMGINWLMGAAYFESKLIDYDVCSNYCNWAYISGVGNDPRPERYFDVARQARTYDPKGEFRKLWLSGEENYAA